MKKHILVIETEDDISSQVLKRAIESNNNNCTVNIINPETYDFDENRNNVSQWALVTSMVNTNRNTNHLVHPGVPFDIALIVDGTPISFRDTLIKMHKTYEDDIKSPKNKREIISQYFYERINEMEREELYPDMKY